MAAATAVFKGAAAQPGMAVSACTAFPPAMRPNRLRELWSAGQPAINGWLAIPSGFAAETMAHQGWDSVTVDLQHGMVDTAAAIEMLTAISTTAAVPLVRVPWLEPGIVMKMLDAGAYGVICPMVSSADEAARLVSLTRYAPRGTRSFGPARALLYAGDDYPLHADATVLRFAMIETAAALDALDAILSVEGLDAIYVGPSDLSLALGCRPVLDDVDPPVAQAIAHIAARAQAHGIVAGIHNGSAAAARRRLALGFRFVSIATDARLMAAAAQQALAEVRR
jgi:4-hydroxy-2-oxoheptanedioate aldolase